MTYTPRDACEFPSDNPDLHSGAAWICLEPLAPARAVLRSSLLSRIQAELLTPARPNKQTAPLASEPSAEQASAGLATASNDDVVARLIALVEHLDPLAPPPPLPDLDLAQESQRMLTAFSLCKPTRIVDNVPAPPAHVYHKVDNVPAPPAHVYRGVEQASAHSESDAEPMTLRGFELATALLRAQSQLNQDSSKTWDAGETDRAIVPESQKVAIAEVGSEAESALTDFDDATQAALTQDQLDLDFDWDQEGAPRSETTRIGGNHAGESQAVVARDQLDLEFEWATESAGEQVEPNFSKSPDSEKSETTLTETQGSQEIETTLAEPRDSQDSREVESTLAEIQDSPEDRAPIEGSLSAEPTLETSKNPDAVSSAVLELVAAHGEPNEPQVTPQSATEQHGFAAFVEALVQVALARGATRAAAIIPNLLRDTQLDASLLSDALVTQLTAAKLGTAHEGSFRVSESLSAVAQAWRNLLDGSSEDFGACDTTLDDWGTTLIQSLLGTQGSHTEIKRELRQRGVAAFGMRAAA